MASKEHKSDALMDSLVEGSPELVSSQEYREDFWLTAPLAMIHPTQEV